MPEKNSFSDRERALETEYFHKKEQELIEKMRRKAALEADRAQMSEEIGVTDQEVLEAFQDMGYSADTIKLLPMVPLVQIAWADGGVTDNERKLILEIGETRGVSPGTLAYDQLIKWIDEEPSQEFYDNTLRGMRYILEGLPENLRELGKTSLVHYLTQIAEVSGGVLGFAKVSTEERALIERVANEIGKGREDRVKKIIEG